MTHEAAQAPVCLDPHPAGYNGDWKFPLSTETIAWYNGRMALRRTRHAVYDSKYHLVWCPKYRKNLFAQECLRERAANPFYLIDIELIQAYIRVRICFTMMQHKWLTVLTELPRE